MAIFVGAALCRSNLLDNCARGQLTTEILHIYVIKSPRVGQVVEVNIRGHNLTEVHIGFFKIVQKVAHGLPELHGCRRSVDSAVRSGNEATLSGAIQRVPGKDTGTCCGAGWHVLGTHRAAFLQVAYGYACELDLGTGG